MPMRHREARWIKTAIMQLRSWDRELSIIGPLLCSAEVQLCCYLQSWIQKQSIVFWESRLINVCQDFDWLTVHEIWSCVCRWKPASKFKQICLSVKPALLFLHMSCLAHQTAVPRAGLRGQVAEPHHRATCSTAIMYMSCQPHPPRPLSLPYGLANVWAILVLAYGFY